jgi:hypothetical protein
MHSEGALRNRKPNDKEGAPADKHSEGALRNRKPNDKEGAPADKQTHTYHKNYLQYHINLP